MTNKQLDNRVKKLRAIEAQQKELEAQAEAIRSELKAALPDVFAAYSRESASRRFTIA